jgi:hypothetical protein
MRDLRSPVMMFAKAGLFLIAWGLCGGIVVNAQGPLERLISFAVGSWCLARAYYFLFYGIEHYVQPGWRHAGVWGMVRALGSRGKGYRNKSPR